MRVKVWVRIMVRVGIGIKDRVRDGNEVWVGAAAGIRHLPLSSTSPAKGNP